MGFPLALVPARAQSLVSLPDAPLPTVAAGVVSTSPGQVVKVPGPPPVSPNPTAHASLEARKWAQSVDPGETVPRLDANDKMKFWLHEELRPSAALPAFVSVGYGEATWTDPKYGPGIGGFGQRLGAAALRQANMRFFCSSVIPTLDGEDPRYYRAAAGSLWRRAGWAAKEAFADRLDNGHHIFNFSNIFGHLGASALTPTYYPPKSRTTDVVLRTWGTSIAGSVGNNLFLEFWPDVVHRWPRAGHFMMAVKSALP
jgi:hypothetical protein